MLCIYNIYITYNDITLEYIKIKSNSVNLENESNSVHFTII